jgi:hypothetical protein
VLHEVREDRIGPGPLHIGPSHCRSVHSRRHISPGYRQSCHRVVDNISWDASQHSVTPTLDVLSCVRLTTFMSSVWCERGFSTMNLIKDRLRNSMSTSLLDDLRMINLNGPALRTPEMSQLLDKAHTRWINIRARNVMKSHRESRTLAQTTEPENSESEEVEELQPLHADTEHSADNNAVYIADPGFIIIPTPNKDSFKNLTDYRFRNEGKVVHIAYNLIMVGRQGPGSGNQ